MIDFTNPSWIQAIAAGLTVPITLIAIIKLFIKDKERTAEIDSLISISKSQEEMNGYFINQLAEMQKQTLQLFESNDILKQQLIITQKYYESDMEISQEKHNIEKMKRRNEIKPQFAFDGSSGSRENHRVKIKNAGKTAYNIEITYHSCENIEFIPKKRQMDELVNGVTIFLEGKVLNNVLHPSYTIKIVFEDEDKNKYYQELSQNKMNSKSTLPLLMNEE